MQPAIALGRYLLVCRSSEGQQATHAGAVVLRDPLLKRALSRREKHELLFEHAIVSLGHERSRKQQQVIALPAFAASLSLEAFHVLGVASSLSWCQPLDLCT